MKTSLQYLLFCLALVAVHMNGLAQPGTWTWMKGVQTPNSVGIFGVFGVPSTNNRPPALYEPAHWTDFAGNFWLFGGGSYQGFPHGALWRFNPTRNMWTWIKGPQGTYYAVI